MVGASAGNFQTIALDAGSHPASRRGRAGAGGAGGADLPPAVVPPYPVAMQDATSAADRQAPRAPRVLVIGARGDTRAAIDRALAAVPAEGIPVVTCSAARHCALVHGVDVAVADEDLADEGAVACLCEFKRAHKCRTVLLARGDPPDRLPAGLDRWVRLPLDAAEFRDAIVTLFH